MRDGGGLSRPDPHISVSGASILGALSEGHTTIESRLCARTVIAHGGVVGAAGRCKDARTWFAWGGLRSDVGRARGKEKDMGVNRANIMVLRIVDDEWS